MLTDGLRNYFSLGFEPKPAASPILASYDSPPVSGAAASAPPPLTAVPGRASAPAAALPPLMLGKKRSTRTQHMLWEVSCWLLLTLGVFLRKGILIVDLGWNQASLTRGAFLASAVIALAVFPPFMKWFNRRRPGVSLENFATAFAFGFFLDLVQVAAHKIVPHWLG